MDLIYAGGMALDGLSGAGVDLLYDGGRLSPESDLDLNTSVVRDTAEAISTFRADLVTRYTAEVMGTFPESRAVRQTAEALCGVPSPEVTRIAVESIGDLPPPVFTTATRVVMEVIATAPYVPDFGITDYRGTVEVLGLAAEILGKHTTTTRATAEVIKSAAPTGRGLNLPAIGLSDEATVFWVIDPARFLTSAGEISLRNADIPFVSIRGDASTLRVSISDGFSERYTLLSTPTSPVVIELSTRIGPGNTVIAVDGVDQTLVGPTTGTWMGFTFNNLGLFRPEGYTNSIVVRSVMVYDRVMTAGERLLVRTYLTCRNISVGCCADCTNCIPGIDTTLP